MAAAKLPPFATQLGLQLLEATVERAVARVRIRPELCNRAGVAAGGVLMAVADLLGNMLTLARMPAEARTTTTESNTNFIGWAPDGTLVQAECTLLHHEPSRTVWQTRITREDGRLVAIITQTQRIYAGE